MGGQNAKQIHGQSKVQIDHPRFQNAYVIDLKGDFKMITTMGIEEKEYLKWKKQISALKSMPDYLLLPKTHQFSTKGFCGSTGTLTVAYDYFPYVLIQEIQNRRKRKSKFQQVELWFLLFNLSAAQIEMKKHFQSKVGDFRPQNIFINQQGQIKVSCLYSWPRETSNFQKTFERIQTLLAPQDMNKLQLGGMDDNKNYQSEMFSIGMTILNAAMLTDLTELYDVKKFKFRYDEANDYLQEWRTNTVYSEILTAFISNLCSFQPEKRLNEKELWSWINKYEDEIKNKEDFFIDYAPLKIQKEIQQMRGESNINMLQQPNRKIPQGMIEQIPQQEMAFEDKSIVFPFMQGLPDQRFTQQPPSNMQRKMVATMIPQLNTAGKQINSQFPNMMSPRETIPHVQTKPMIQSVHHNIPTAESMYAPIPQEMMENQYVKLPPGQYSQLNPNQPPPPQFRAQYLASLQGLMPHHLQSQLPPGVISSRGPHQNGFSQPNGFQAIQRSVSPQQQSFPSNIIPISPNNGNFVYTRRIIDPKNNSIVAQERIGQDQFQRGLGNMDEPTDQNY